MNPEICPTDLPRLDSPAAAGLASRLLGLRGLPAPSDFELCSAGLGSEVRACHRACDLTRLWDGHETDYTKLVLCR